MVGLLLLLGLPLGGRHIWAYWHYREAQKAMGLRDFAGAQQHFVQSLKVWSTSTDVHLKAARAARKAGDFDETERLLHQCIDLGGDAEAIYLEQLLLKVQRGRLSEAEPLLVNRVLDRHRPGCYSRPQGPDQRLRPNVFGCASPMPLLYRRSRGLKKFSDIPSSARFANRRFCEKQSLS